MKKENLYKYDEEAEALIQLVLSEANPTRRNSRVASWLREYVSAWSTGCTGLSADPDGPPLPPFRSRPGETNVEPPATVEESLARYGQYPPPRGEAERHGWPMFRSLDERRDT